MLTIFYWHFQRVNPAAMLCNGRGLAQHELVRNSSPEKNTLFVEFINTGNSFPFVLYEIGYRGKLEANGSSCYEISNFGLLLYLP